MNGKKRAFKVYLEIFVVLCTVFVLLSVFTGSAYGKYVEVEIEGKVENITEKDDYSNWKVTVNKIISGPSSIDNTVTVAHTKESPGKVSNNLNIDDIVRVQGHMIADEDGKLLVSSMIFIRKEDHFIKKATELIDVNVKGEVTELSWGDNNESCGVTMQVKNILRGPNSISNSLFVIPLSSQKCNSLAKGDFVEAYGDMLKYKSGGLVIDDLLFMNHKGAHIVKILRLNLFDPQIDGHTVKLNGVAQGNEGNFRWNWGDGTIEQSWFPNSHTYSSAGTYTIKVTSYSGSGDSITRSKRVTIEEADLEISLDRITDSQGQKVTESVFTSGETYSLYVEVVNNSDTKGKVAFGSADVELIDKPGGFGNYESMVNGNSVYLWRVEKELDKSYTVMANGKKTVKLFSFTIPHKVTEPDVVWSDAIRSKVALQNGEYAFTPWSRETTILPGYYNCLSALIDALLNGLGTSNIKVAGYQVKHLAKIISRAKTAGEIAKPTILESIKELEAAFSSDSIQELGKHYINAWLKINHIDPTIASQMIIDSITNLSLCAASGLGAYWELGEMAFEEGILEVEKLEEAIKEFFGVSEIKKAIRNGDMSLCQATSHGLIGVWPAITSRLLKSGTFTGAESPVDIIIRDDAGRITGYMDGSKFSEIPNSTVVTRNSKKFVKLPKAIKNYDVVMIGTGKGMLDFSLGWEANETKGVRYEDIPVSKGSAYILGSEANNPGGKLYIDNDDDSSYEKTLNPDKSINLEKSPPVAQLSSGWNLISTPGIPQNPDPGTALGDDIDSLQLYYDYSNGDYTNYPGTSTQLIWEQGYWTHVSEETPVDMDVTVPTKDYILEFTSEDWNMIGVPYSVDWSQVNFSDPSDFQTDGAGHVRLVSWDPVKESYFNHYSDTSHVLSPWDGCWIKVKDASSSDPASITVTETTQSPAATGTRTPLPQSVDRDQLDYPPLPQELDDSFRALAYPNPLMEKNKVTFTVQMPNVEEIKVTIANTAGELVYNSGYKSGSKLTWDPKDSTGEKVANGIYLYKIQAKDGDGTTQSSEVKRLLVLQ